MRGRKTTTVSGEGAKETVLAEPADRARSWEVSGKEDCELRRGVLCTGDGRSYRDLLM